MIRKLSNPAAVVALLMAAGGVSAGGDDSFVPAAGLWQLDLTSDLGSTAMEFCSDGITMPGPLARLGQPPRAIAADKCLIDPARHDGETTVSHAVCQLDAKTRSDTTVKRRGDFKERLELVQETRVVTPGSEMELSIKAAGRGKGACPVDMSPGDVRLPNGQIVKSEKAS